MGHLIERLRAERLTQAGSSLELVLSIVDRLNPRERLVVQMRAAGASFTAIGDRLGVTRQRARELFRKALHRAPFLAGDLALSYADPAVSVPKTDAAALARKRDAARRRRLLVEQGRLWRRLRSAGEGSLRVFASPDAERATSPRPSGPLPACRKAESCARQ